MRTIFRIARLELATLFYSPIAWLILLVFFLQGGIIFTDRLSFLVSYSESIRPIHGSISRSVYFNQNRGLFNDLIAVLYMYIPLLTMGLISRELNSGSIKLLLSSPVRIREIVLGKYLAMLLYNLIMASILVLFVCVGSFCVEHFDYGLMISCVIGVYILICAYAAIGLFMSSLTSYQVVAAISTLVILGVLNYLRSIGQWIAWVRDITYYICLNGRTNNFLKGLISSKELFYFLIIISFFLALTYLKIKRKTESRPAVSIAGRYSLLLLLVFIAGYVTSRPGWIFYADLTATHSQSISQYSRQLVDRIKSPVTITSYENILAPNSFGGLPSDRSNDRDFWERYVRYLPQTKFKYINFYDWGANKDEVIKTDPGVSIDEHARKQITFNKIDTTELLTPAQIKKRIDLSQEENRYVRQVSIGGRSEFLRVYDEMGDGQPSETEIMTVFKRFLDGPSKAGIVTGDRERSTDQSTGDDYSLLTKRISYRYAMINQGFDLDTLMLDKQAIPMGLDLLILADPKTALSPQTVSEIQKYIDAGGNLLLTTDPRQHNCAEPILNKLGIHTLPGELFTYNKELPAQAMQLNFSSSASYFIKSYYDQAIKLDSARIASYGALTFRCDTNKGFAVRPVLINPSSSWYSPTASSDTVKIRFNKSRDQRGLFPIAIALTRKIGKREQRIMVLGDADILANGNIMKAPDHQNFEFSQGVLRWFTYDKFPLTEIKPTATRDNNFLITSVATSRLRIFLVGVLPGLMLIAGITLLIIRKRR